MPTGQLRQAEANVEESEGGDDEEEEEAQVIPESPKSKRTTSKPDRKWKAIVEFPEKSDKKRPMRKLKKCLEGRGSSSTTLLWLLRREKYILELNSCIEYECLPFFHFQFYLDF